MGNVENILSAFSQEIRLRMAILLLDSSLCVNCLKRVLGLPQSTISRHLAMMRRGGLVKVRRDNTHCYYTFDKEGHLGQLKNNNTGFENINRLLKKASTALISGGNL